MGFMPKDKQISKSKTADKRAADREADPASKRQADGKRGNALWAGIFIIIIVFALAGGLVYGLNSGRPASFSTFQGNFNSAPRVAILVTANNGTQLAATVGCATALIQQIVASRTSHRNASTIDYYVMNATSCVFSPTGIGGSLQNYSYTTPKACVNVTTREPSIFINYTTTNETIINARSLVVEGDYRFLSQCAVASEIVST